MKIVNLLVGLLALLPLTLAPAARMAAPASFESVKAQAESAYAEGSYARAHEAYASIRTADLPESERRWVAFRLADTLWRSEAATETSDTTKLDQAREQLETILRETKDEEARDLVWAETNESLADFWWTRDDSRNFSSAQGYYQAALDWWAGSRDLDVARARYLSMVWRMAQPRWADSGNFYGQWATSVPQDILENAVKIARDPRDVAHAHYLLALQLRQRGDLDARDRVADEFDAALAAGKTEWSDDALFSYAQWLEGGGPVVYDDDGNWRGKPDYVKALELYRRIVTEYRKGESAYWEQAKNLIDSITRPAVSVSVSNFFIPGSEISFSLAWRNLGKVDLKLTPVDLPRDIHLSGDNDWLRSIDSSSASTLTSWSKDGGDAADHVPHNESVKLERKLAPGAYLLEASGGGAYARELILVTDVAIVLKTSPSKAVVYLADVDSGAPVANARVQLWQSYYDNGTHYATASGTTNADGLATIALPRHESNNVFVAAARNDRQAIAGGWSYSSSRPGASWKIYATTDRPAYRPEEKVQWKFTAREFDGETYSTPSGATVSYEVKDPRGAKVFEGKAKLNEFGSAWGTFELTPSMPLGEYGIDFRDGRTNYIGSATLFRLEEYKLPEFRVDVTTADESGERKTYQLGDRVTVNIAAEYYFGGPVANASVEAVVYRQPYYHWWTPYRDFDWYSDSQSIRPRYYGGDQIVKRETLTTDENGRATITIDSPSGEGQDIEYRIEARVVDASRREITGEGRVRVTRQAYYAHLDPKRVLLRPGEKVSAELTTIDANDDPVSASGTVRVTREQWREVWLDPAGREVADKEIQKLRASTPLFPPPDQPGWRIRKQGYESEEILKTPLKTDAKGSAEFSFTPEREGYYRIAWKSDPSPRKNDRVRPRSIVTADTTVWIANKNTGELGYVHDGLEIIVDRDGFRAGRSAPVMIASRASDRWVLFTVEGEDIMEQRLVHLDGSVKLLDLAVEEKHQPNVFLTASMIVGRDFFSDTKEIVVPPVEHFLDVDVKSDREEYQPRDEATLTVTARDSNGKPVATEVSLSLVDESVFSIQKEYAGDPRPFFFGTKRAHFVQTTSSFAQKRYVREEEVDKITPARDDERKKKDEALGVEGGVVGGLAEASRMNAQIPMAKAVPQKSLAMDQAMPAPAAPPPAEAGGEVVVVRSDFRSTVLWQPDLMTDANGKAVVHVTYPDSLTTWRATARAATRGSQFGMATSTTRTKKPLIVRLQTPRFFLVGDRVTVSAVINNNTSAPLTVAPSIDAKGVEVVNASAAPVTVAAGREGRVDWAVNVRQAGTATLRVKGVSGNLGDAMEKTFTVYEHGIDKLVARTGKMRGDEALIKLDLPDARRSTEMFIDVTPSIAVTMLDAVPYLIQYPYGCTEQTMSRFLPAIIVARTLRDLHADPEVVATRIFGGIEQEHAAATHPDGQKNLGKLDDVTRAGLARLYDFQHSDGGWGWWKDGDSDPFMTAYVVWGLTLARDAGVTIREDAANRAVSFLDTKLVEAERSYDLQAWMVHAATAHRASHRETATPLETKALDNLWTNRDRLNAYSRSLFALAANAAGQKDRAQTLVRNLENGVKIDRAPDASILMKGDGEKSALATAHWGEDGLWWRWSDSPVEATSTALRALMAIDPSNELVEPVMNWLVKNRRGAQWNNTRDTAMAVLALDEYLKRSGEMKSAIDYEVLVNGQSVGRRSVSPSDVLAAPSRFKIPASLVRSANEIRIRRLSGTSPLYFAVQANFFSLEEPIRAAGSEIFVRRDYFKMVGHPTLLKGHAYDRVPLADGGEVKSGERVEVVVTVETKNDYEYLLFEDLKPAGFEAIEVQSGQPLYANELKSGASARATSGTRKALDSELTGRSRWVYQELRDRKVAMFVDKLPQGIWQIRYTLRAEVPGEFHALPVMGGAMYVPEIRGNGDEVRVRVVE